MILHRTVMTPLTGCLTPGVHFSLRRRKFLVTTDSNPEHPVYPNGAADLALTGINQLWVADITSIRLESEFVYWAVILDAFSRRS